MYREHRSINARNVGPIDIIIIVINGWTSVLICIEHCVLGTYTIYVCGHVAMR